MRMSNMKRSSWASGRGIRPLLLDRVLRRQHKKGARQFVRTAADSDLEFLHGLHEGGLGLGRSPVDLVGQEDVGEHGPLDEAELAAAGAPALLDDLGPGDIR